MKAFRAWSAVAVVGMLLACEDGVAPDAVLLEFSASAIAFTDAGFTTVTLRNAGIEGAGPIQLMAGEVTDSAGAVVAAAQLVVTPAEIPMLDPGDVHEVTLVLQGHSALPGGLYGATVDAIVLERVVATATTSYRRLPGPGDAVTSVTITAAPSAVVQGDVHALSAEALDSSGAAVEDAVTWRVVPTDAGLTTADGWFVAFLTGAVKVIASAGQHADTAVVQVSGRGLSGTFSVVGHGEIADRFTSDLWLHDDVAYSGTWATRAVGGDTAAGNTMFAWDISDPAQPTLTDSVQVDAQVVNDVKIRSDGKLAVLTHEGSENLLNGITLLDTSDPFHPRETARFTEGLTTGVHNVWIESDFVYAAVDGGGGRGLQVVDVADPENPSAAGTYYAGSSFLHDVYVREGLAFLSHWDAGLVILDVGGGGMGGSPHAPVELGRVITEGGDVHNAWYWPERSLVFVGEEDFSSPGYMHVVDVSDLGYPVEVASFAVPGGTPHNFWLDETNAVLYMAWYSQGIVAVDVSGELLGPLDRQGRQIARFQYNGGGTCPGSTSAATCTWAPQLHQGLIWVSDMNTGIWSLRLDRP